MAPAIAWKFSNDGQGKTAQLAQPGFTARGLAVSPPRMVMSSITTPLKLMNDNHSDSGFQTVAAVGGVSTTPTVQSASQATLSSVRSTEPNSSSGSHSFRNTPVANVPSTVPSPNQSTGGAAPIGAEPVLTTGPGAIRPMTVAPQNASSPAVSSFNSTPTFYAGAPATSVGSAGAEWPRRGHASGHGIVPLSSGSATLTYTGGGPVYDKAANTYYDVVGDSVNFVVTAAAQEKLSTVTWTVTPGAEQGQTYTFMAGITTAFPPGGVIHPNLQGSTDFLFINWDAQTGVHTVTTSIVYQDGTKDTASFKCTILQPNIDSFTDTYTPNIFGPYGDAPKMMGFDQYGIATGGPGNIFAAVVDMATDPNKPPAVTPPGGIFAVLQLVSVNDSYTDSTNTTYTLNTGGFVNDDVPNNNSLPGGLMLSAYISSFKVGGAQNVAIPGQDPSQPVDSPKLAGQVDLFQGGVWWKSISESDQFQSYLVYKAQNGIWVALSEIDWTVAGSATYNGPTPANAGTSNDYANPANWTITKGSVNPATSGTLKGKSVNLFVSWSGYFTDFNFRKS